MSGGETALLIKKIKKKKNCYQMPVLWYLRRDMCNKDIGWYITNWVLLLKHAFRSYISKLFQKSFNKKMKKLSNFLTVYSIFNK